MSLADQLLDYSSDEEDIVIDNENELHDEVEQELGNININLTTINDITKVSKLKFKLEPIIVKIENDTDFDYDFIILVNSYSQSIISEIELIHNYIKIHYNAIFPELSTLIASPADYARTVKLLGNDLIKNVAIKEEELKSFLPKEKLLVISMSSSLKQPDYGVTDITNVLKASDLIIELNDYKTKIMTFVSHNLIKFAPNLSNLIGPFIAAQLISSVGSLQNLAITPSCNLPLIGNKRQMGVGYSNGGVKFQGYLYETDFVQNVPDDYKKQLLRMLSGKIVLCARIDLSKSENEGKIGLNYKEELLNKLEKIMLPPEQLKIKLLPLPIDQKSKKRGGKRFSKLKKNFEMSDMQKLQNKMSFGEKEETYIDAFGEEIGLGMAARSNNGNLRMLTISDSGPKAKMTKKMASRLENFNNSATDDELFSFGDGGRNVKKLENGTAGAVGGGGGSSRWFDDEKLTRKRATDDLQARILKKLKKS